MNWANYLKAKPVGAPNLFYLKSLEYISFPKRFVPIAVDLGCGVGNETTDLVCRGWKTLAIDAQWEALNITKSRIPKKFAKNLTIKQCSFEKLEVLPKVNFAYGSLSLPFCSVRYYPALWKNVLNCIEPKGYLALSLFNRMDLWARRGLVRGESVSSVRKRLGGFEILYLSQVMDMAVTPNGKEKTWHLINVIARKS